MLAFAMWRGGRVRLRRVPLCMRLRMRGLRGALCMCVASCRIAARRDDPRMIERAWLRGRCDRWPSMIHRREQCAIAGGCMLVLHLQLLVEVTS
jgi:hypothetical protein